MNVSIIIATHGDEAWRDLAMSRAYPSTIDQGAWEVIAEHWPDGTLAQARNHAAKRSDTAWLCFLDADDELGPGYIQAMYEARYDVPPDGGAHPLLIPRVQFVKDTTFSAPVFPNVHQPMDTLNHAVIGTLVRRSLFEQVGGFGEEPVYEDWALWLRCMRAGAALHYVEDAIYQAHVQESSRNNSMFTRAVYERIRAEHRSALA